MDVYCPITGCGEPVEIDSLHDTADEQGTDFITVLHNFQTRGCAALGYEHSEGNVIRSDAMAAIFDFLGDDVDGAAAIMEDAESLGLF